MLAIDVTKDEGRIPPARVGSSRTITSEKATLESAEEGCIPGQYWCDQAAYEWVMVCNQAGQWEKSSYCGETSQGYGW
jgi:hypothetical protein